MSLPPDGSRITICPACGEAILTTPALDKAVVLDLSATLVTVEEKLMLSNAAPTWRDEEWNEEKA